MEANSPALRATVVGATAPIVWGSTYLVTTELLPPDVPMTAAATRALPAGLILVLISRRWPREWAKVTTLALANIGAFFPLLFVAAYRLPGGQAAIVGSFQPFVVALMSWLIGQGKTPGRQLGWAAVAVAGVALAMTGGPGSYDVLGVVAATAGTVSMAIGVSLTRAWGPTKNLTGLASTGWQLLIGGAFICPLIPLLDIGDHTVDGPALAGFAYLGLIGGAVAYSAWFYAARRLPSTSTALLSVLSPIVAALAGWIVLGQSLTTLQTVGFGLALVASIAGQRRERRRTRRRVRTTSATPTSVAL